MEPLVENNQYEEKSIIDRAKEFKNSHPVMFWTFVLVIVVLIGVIVAVVVIYGKRDKDKESYTTTNDVSSEFDYVNSYIYSTLGETEDEKASV